jgi:hypothetical protein
MSVMGYVFDTEAAVEVASGQWTPIMTAKLIAYGYAFDGDGHCIPKNRNSGANEPDSQHAEIWDNANPLTNGKFYVRSFRDKWTVSYPELEAAIGKTPEDVTALLPVD